MLLTQDGHIKITDFGLATLMKDNEKTYTVYLLVIRDKLAGTPEYLAPEIIKRTGHSFEVDLWTLGVLIFEMSTGVPPFTDKGRNIKKI
jgi:serum/glucocorticoid-regulated kinase 2